jgi:hypothetical protein
MNIKMTIHSTGTGTCSLTGNEGTDGLTVSFEDGTLGESFLSWRGFRQLLGMKAGLSAKKPTVSNAPVTSKAPRSQRRDR